MNAERKESRATFAEEEKNPIFWDALREIDQKAGERSFTSSNRSFLSSVLFILYRSIFVSASRLEEIAESHVAGNDFLPNEGRE